MEPEGSLPHSQEPATCPYPEPDQSSPRPHPPQTTSLDLLTLEDGTHTLSRNVGKALPLDAA
jgi:hypothetical protein